MPSVPSDAIPGTRAAAVEAELRRLILSGELPVGSRLRQVEISERFGVSTTPVREAFATLAREGLVEQDAHRGVTVVLPGQDDLRENYLIRSLLEPLAAEHAADHIGDEELKELRERHRRMRAASAATDDVAAAERERATANHEFHNIIYAAARRPRLLELIEQLRNSAAIFSRLAVTAPPPSYLNQANREHAAILAALKDHDGPRAGEAVRIHLEHNLQAIAKTLGELTGEPSDR